jgi:hypothetical protein
MLAGGAGAVGLIGAYEGSNPLTLLSLFVLLALPTGACVFCLTSEQPERRIADVAWWTVAAPLATIAGLWLLQAFGVYGFLVMTLVVVTSPPVTRRVAMMLTPGWGTGGRAGHHPDYDRLERDVVNLRFEELVSGLQDPGEAKDR